MNIVIFGHVCIDKNISESSSYIAAGGPAMFITKIVTQLPHCLTTIIAPYGKDFLIYTKKINLYPSQPTTEHTLVYENITKNKNRIQKCFHYETANPVSLNDEIIQILKKADILYIAPLVPNISSVYLQSITKYVQKKCLKILLPQGYFRKFNAKNVVQFREFTEAETVLSLVDVIVVSEQDYPEMEQVAKEWVKKFGMIVLVTTGEKGAVILSKNQVMLVPTNPVAEKDIVDSVGSGDIFSAGFGYWYKRTQDVVASTDFANRLARQCLFYPSEEILIDYKFLISNHLIRHPGSEASPGSQC